MKTKEINNKIIYLYFSDIAGNEKYLTISSKMLNNAVNCGLLIDSSDIAGIAEIFESEYVIYPQLDSLQIKKIENQSYYSYKCTVTTIGGININKCLNELMNNALCKAKQFGLIDINKNKNSKFLFKSNKPKILQSAS